MSDFFLDVARDEWNALPRYRADHMAQQTREDLERITKLIAMVEKFGDNRVLRMLGIHVKPTKKLSRKEAQQLLLAAQKTKDEQKDAKDKING
jgi:hypothetical protein